MRFSSLVGLVACTVFGLIGCNKKSDSQRATILEGEWAVVTIAGEEEGERIVLSPEQVKGMTWSIKGSEITGTGPDGSTGKMSFNLNPGTTPEEINIASLDGNRKGETDPGIYSLEEGRLRVCLGEPDAVGSGRPTEFRVSRQSWMIELEKIKR